MNRMVLLIIITVLAVASSVSLARDRVEELEEKVAELESRVARIEGLLRLAESAKTPSVQPRNYKNKANWRQLKLGMTKAQVTAILGDPPKVQASSVIGDMWYYPDVLGGHVSFDVSGRVNGWSEP